jgi:uncharacterized membrane-anchored protein YjiN (DUF445 family)
MNDIPLKSDSKGGIAATLVLCASLVLFLTCQYFRDFPNANLQQILPWIKAFAEASLVGGLADWFAVTALFRSPLGLPIPHTGIIARSKQRIARGIGSFISTNYLNRAELERRIIDGNFSKKATIFLFSKKSRYALIEMLQRKLPRFIKGDTFHKIQNLAVKVLSDSVGRIKFGQLFKEIRTIDKDDKLFDGTLAALLSILKQHEKTIGNAIKESLPWYVPGFVHSEVYNRTLKHVVGSIEEILSGESPELRAKAIKAVNEIVESISNSENVQTSIRSFIDHFDQQALNNLQNRLLEKGQNQLLAFVSDSPSFSRVVNEALEFIYIKFTTEEKLQQSVNVWATNTIEALFNQHRSTIEELLAETIKRWDEKDFTNRIEGYVYNDLQYIRINGAVVGGLVGILIHATELLFSGAQ